MGRWVGRHGGVRDRTRVEGRGSWKEGSSEEGKE